MCLFLTVIVSGGKKGDKKDGKKHGGKKKEEECDCKDTVCNVLLRFETELMMATLEDGYWSATDVNNCCFQAGMMAGEIGRYISSACGGNGDGWCCTSACPLPW